MRAPSNMEQMNTRPIESNWIENVKVVNDNPEQNANEQLTAHNYTWIWTRIKKSLEYIEQSSKKRSANHQNDNRIRVDVNLSIWRARWQFCCSFCFVTKNNSPATIIDLAALVAVKIFNCNRNKLFLLCYFVVVQIMVQSFHHQQI